MGKASSNKKVARVAGTGGGRTARGRRPYGWYTVLAVLSALGVFLIAFSRHQVQASAAVHPRGADHWHAAYGIDLCGTMQPNLAQNSNLNDGLGLHTHGDGLIHVEPFSSTGQASDLGGPDTGLHATVARFAQLYPGFKLSKSEIQVPGGKLYKNGDKCDGKVSGVAGKAAQVRIRVWDKADGSTSITYNNPADVHLKNGQAITIAFLPPTVDIPKPPAGNIANLTNPNAQEGGTSSTSLQPSVSVLPPTTAPGSATTAPASPATTAGSPPTTK